MRGLSISTITQHIRQQLGEDEVRPVEVILAFNDVRGEKLDALYTKHLNHAYRTFEKHAISLGLIYEEARLYYDVRQSRALRGDIYVFISDIELGLHQFVRNILIQSFGPEESQWWRKGIPAAVRKTCAQSREDDPDPVTDPYCYTTFIHLSDIIDANWSIFRPVFPEKIIRDRKQLLAKLRDLNHLRNAVMHPVKRKPWRPVELTAIKVLHDLLQTVYSTT